MICNHQWQPAGGCVLRYCAKCKRLQHSLVTGGWITIAIDGEKAYEPSVVDEDFDKKYPYNPKWRELADRSERNG